MSLTDYSDFEKEIDEAPEFKILPRGSEVQARIVSVDTGISEKNGARWYRVNYDVPSEPLAKMFNDFFWDLADRSKLTEKGAIMALNQFKNFRSAFGVDISKPFSWEDDLPGLKGWMILGVQKSDEYGESNKVSRYIVGK